MPLENKKQIFIIAGALAAGICAVLLASNYVRTSIQNQTAALADQYETKQKQMAGQIMQRSDQQMAALAQELQRVKQEQQATIQKQMTALQEAQRQSQAQALALAKAPAQAAAPKRKPSLALKTPVGKRAMTVKIDSLAAVGGMLNAGDFVDVIAQLNMPSQDANNKTLTTVIFQGLQILAINTNLDDPGAYDEQQSAASLKVTLAVDPQESGLLAFANKNGNLQMVLRSPDESEHQLIRASTWKSLGDYVMKNQGVNIEDPDGLMENNKPAESRPNIQIFRGGKEL